MKNATVVKQLEIGGNGSEPGVHGFLHQAEDPRAGIVLTHGAGANSEAPLLKALANVFAELGMTVLRIDLPFRQLRPLGPPMRGSAEKDQHGIRRAVDAMRKEVSGRVYMGGHSYGGRQASMLAAAEPGLVDGLLLLSYPLHPPKQPGQMRTAHFPKLQTRSLFVSGSRDGFGTVEEMSEALKLISAETRLVVIESAGHELMSKRNAEELPGRVLEAFQGFFG